MYDIIRIIHTYQLIGISKNIEIAKGFYHLPTSFKDLYTKIWRFSKV